jgi:hypothetical protein
MRVSLATALELFKQTEPSLCDACEKTRPDKICLQSAMWKTSISAQYGGAGFAFGEMV